MATGNHSLNLNEESEEFMCAICLDLYFEPTILDPCEHVFCGTCLGPLGNRLSTCPICRQDIQNYVPALELYESVQNSRAKSPSKKPKATRKPNRKKKPKERRSQ